MPKPKLLTTEEYKSAQMHIEWLASQLVTMPLEEFIATTERNVKFGPTLDAKLWAKTGKKVIALGEIARKLLEVKREVDRYTAARKAGA